MVTAEFDAVLRQLIREQPDVEYFYKLSLEYTDGSTGYLTFHSLAVNPDACQAAVQSICGQLKTKRDLQIAELRALPEEDKPYDPALPAGCVVSLCFILPDRQHYVAMQSQNWDLTGLSHHSSLIPDVFDIGYYLDKARHGEYLRSWLKPLNAASR